MASNRAGSAKTTDASLAAIADDEDADAEARQAAEGRLRELGDRIDAIVSKPPVIDEEMKARAGAFLVAFVDQDFDVAVAGQDSLVHKTVSTRELFEDTLSLVSLEFELDERAESTEVRLYVQKGVLIEVDELVIFSRRPRNWSGK